jgi:hypothetical protein
MFAHFTNPLVYIEQTRFQFCDSSCVYRPIHGSPTTYILPQGEIILARQYYERGKYPRKEHDKAMKKNVGDTDAYLRIAGGLAMVGFGIIDRSRWMVALGAMKVAEGITRHCPLLQLLGMNTTGQEPEPEMVRSDVLLTE